MTEPKLMTLAPTAPELVANDWNTNIVTPENEAKLEASIKRNGLFKPIIVREVDGRLEVIGGEHRWQVAVRLGLKEIPIVNLGPIDEARAKEISVIDNARYGIDDTLSFGELLKEMGALSDLQEYLPYTETDLADLFSSTDISLDDLETEAIVEDPAANDEKPAPKPPKTHTIMKFKVGLRDAERLSALVSETQKHHGLSDSDQLTNAGDALVQILVDAGVFARQAVLVQTTEDGTDEEMLTIPLEDLDL